ncbi:hypothetical protein AAMO2058_000755400 [Amorphochlora amoebiformis]
MSTSKPDSKSAPGLLGKGKELLKNKEYEKAVEVLGEALQMMVDIEGKVAKECAPYYFEYGQALLETSKATQALLGSKAAGEPEGENDEPSDLQIAWELFETCRVIYERQLAEEDSKEIHLAMAEVYISLADISREEEKFTESYNDMGQALKIFEQRLAPDDRRIAFAHQMMAMDCVFSNQNDKAVPHYENVREVLGERIVSLYKKIGVLSSQGNLTKKANGKATRSDAQVDAKIEKIESKCVAIKKIAEEIIDIKDMRDEVNEKIASLGENPLKDAEAKNGGSNSGKTSVGFGSKGGSTTMGFGSSSSAGSTTIGFGNTSSASNVKVNSLGTFGSSSNGKGKSSAPMKVMRLEPRKRSAKETEKENDPAKLKKAKLNT